MHPLSFAEFMSEYEGNKYDGWNEYVLYGGLPPVVLLSTLEQKIAFLKNLFKETYINDIIHKHNVKNKDEFEELIDILSSGIGSLTLTLHTNTTLQMCDLFPLLKRMMKANLFINN